MLLLMDLGNIDPEQRLVITVSAHPHCGGTGVNALLHVGLMAIDGNSAWLRDTVLLPRQSVRAMNPL